MTNEIANKIYDVLVVVGGASKHMRDSFVYAHTSDEICDEWRFSGNLGFGGKYWKKRNLVNYYSEDETKERDILVDKINKLLSDIVNGDKNVSTS
jgi:hypothetical protein